MASVTSRLTSSGIRRSPLRRPASTWQTWIPSFVATRLAAMVEFTSPTTSTIQGRSASQTGSKRSMISAVWAAWDPDPTPRSTWGGGI